MTNCNCEKNSLRSIVSSVAVDSGNTFLILTPDEALTPINEQKISIKVIANIPSNGMTLPCYLVVNGSNVPIFDKFGNILYGANLRQKIAMHGYFGTNGTGGNPHFQIVNYPFGRCC